MNRLFFRWIVLPLLISLSGAGTAALAQYQFDHWTTDNGLPQNAVHDILQTRDGYLWMTTSDGLARFDGVRFTIFNKHNSPGITNNRFLTIYEDAQGDLWANTEDSEITRRHAGRFTTYTAQDGLPRDLFSLSGDAQGNLIVLNGDRVLRWANGKFQSATTFSTPDANSEAFRRPVPCTLDIRGKATCVVNGGIQTWTQSDGWPDTYLMGMVRDPRGPSETLWASLKNYGLGKIENGRLVKIYTGSDGLPGILLRFVSHRGRPQAFITDAGGKLWLMDLVSMQSDLVTAHPPKGMENMTAVLAVHEDREGNFWFGTHLQGLYRLRRQVITTYSKPQGLTGDVIYPIYEDRAGAIWIGAQGEGLFRLKDGAIKQYRGGASAIDNHFSALYQDRAGRLWAGVWDRLMRMEEDRLVPVSPEIAPPTLANYWTIFEDREGSFWFGGNNGVVRYKDGASIILTTKDGLAGDNTKVIVEDGAGNLWLGSYGGLTRYKNGRFTIWTEKDGLPSNNVRSLYPDSEGVLWIGTYDGGLGRFKDGKFTRYTTREGLFDNGVFQILEDGASWFWMSCNLGIYRVRKQELNDFAAGRLKTITSIAYGKSDGMLNVECNGGRWPAGAKGQDGKLWFPTMGGVAMIDPATVAANPQPPPVRIETIKVDNQVTSAEDLSSGIRIEPGQHSLEIEYTALSFINSAHLKFKYKLEELDDDWTDAGGRRTAYYPHLPPGAYNFHVIAANSDGVWNQEGARLRILVLPPFYRTWWFLTLLGLGLAGVVGLVFRSRVARIEQQRALQQAFSQQLIESQERERKRIAAELHDSLGQNLMVVKNRAMLSALTLPDEEAKARFNEISASVAQTLEEVRTIAYNLRPYHLDQLGLTTAIVATIQRVEASCEIEFTHEVDDLDGLFAPAAEITLFRIV